MSDETSVYIDALTAFGVQLYEKDSLAVEAGLTGPAGDMGSAIVGMVGTTEAQSFAAWIAGILEAFGYFTRDTGLGYPSLGGVAIIMRSHYVHGDLSQADAMNNATADVMDAFNPAAGTKTIADTTTLPAITVTQPTNSPSGLPDPTTCKMPGQPATPNSPFAKWTEHQDRYQKWETWRPIEPDPSPQAPATPPSETLKAKSPVQATPSPSNSQSSSSSNNSKQPQQPSNPQSPICKPSK